MVDTQANVGMIILLIVGVCTAILSLIFIGALGGQTFQLTEDKISSIGRSIITGETWDNMRSGIVFTLAHNETTWDVSVYSLNETAILDISQFTIDNNAGTLILNNDSLNGTYATIDYYYGNTTIQDNIKGGIVSSFSALNLTGSYLPMIVLAIIIVLVLSLMIGMTGMNKGQMGGAL